MLSPAFAQEKIQDASARSDFIYRVNLGRADDVRLLMRQGSSPNQLSGEGVPVLCLAAGRVDPEGVNVTQALLEAGANLNGRDGKGQTALFYAAKAGNIATINYLLDAGIDMYALDNNGDVARTIAHRSGQQEALKAIDDYTLGQTAKLIKPLTPEVKGNKGKSPKGPSLSPGAGDAEKDAKEPPAPPAAQAADATPTAVATNEAPAPKTTDVTPPAAAENTSAEGTETTEPAKNEQPAEEKKSENKKPEPDKNEKKPAKPKLSPEEMDKQLEIMKNMIYDMSFNVCAFQYWFYCSSAKQSTDLEREELIIAIESSRSKAEALQKELNKRFHLPKSYVETVSESAQNRIYAELNGMASNRDRHEKGVGKRDDMQERCELIARQWGVKSIPKEQGGEAGKSPKAANGGKGEGAGAARASKAGGSSNDSKSGGKRKSKGKK